MPSAYFAPAGGGGRALEPFKTELGSVSVPTLEAIKAWMPEKDWYDLNDDWALHDLCSGAQAGNTFPTQIATRYGAIAKRDLADFVRKSQMAMYETYRAMYEGRQAKLFNPCSGVLTWMSNPSQPLFVWQIYSYDLEPLAALYGAKKACEPVHVQLNQNDWHVMVVNTLPKPQPGLQAAVRIFNMDGTLKSEKTLPVIRQAVCGDGPGRAAVAGRPFARALRQAGTKGRGGQAAFGELLLADHGHDCRRRGPGRRRHLRLRRAGARRARWRWTGRRSGRGGGFSLLQTLPTAEVQVTLGARR